MKEFKKVTWYSKLLALITLLTVVFSVVQFKGQFTAYRDLEQSSIKEIKHNIDNLTKTKDVICAQATYGVMDTGIEEKVFMQIDGNTVTGNQLTKGDYSVLPDDGTTHWESELKILGEIQGGVMDLDLMDDGIIVQSANYHLNESGQLVKILWEGREVVFSDVDCSQVLPVF